MYYIQLYFMLLFIYCVNFVYSDSECFTKFFRFPFLCDDRCLGLTLIILFTLDVYVVLHSETQESDIQLNPGSFMQNMQKMFGE